MAHLAKPTAKTFLTLPEAKAIQQETPTDKRCMPHRKTGDYGWDIPDNWSGCNCTTICRKAIARLEIVDSPPWTPGTKDYPGITGEVTKMTRFTESPIVSILRGRVASYISTDYVVGSRHQSVNYGA